MRSGQSTAPIYIIGVPHSQGLSLSATIHSWCVSWVSDLLCSVSVAWIAIYRESNLSSPVSSASPVGKHLLLPAPLASAAPAWGSCTPALHFVLTSSHGRCQTCFDTFIFTLCFLVCAVNTSEAKSCGSQRCHKVLDLCGACFRHRRGEVWKGCGGVTLDD